MNYVVLSESVLRGFCRMHDLVDEIRCALWQFGVIYDNFGRSRDQIKLLHRASLALLQAIGAPLDEFRALGWRTREEDWQDPPLNTEAAIQNVRGIMMAMEPWITFRNGRLPVLGYQSLFGTEFDTQFNFVQSLQEEDPIGALDHLDPRNMAGATPEQINGMPVHLASEDDTHQDCTICLATFVAGEQIKILSCSHRFHKRCIDDWLAISATCPMDRSIVFEN